MFSVNPQIAFRFSKKVLKLEPKPFGYSLESLLKKLNHKVKKLDLQ